MVVKGPASMLKDAPPQNVFLLSMLPLPPPATAVRVVLATPKSYF